MLLWYPSLSESYCTDSVSHCCIYSQTGKTLYDHGNTSVLLGRHPWRRSWCALTLAAELLIHELHMEHISSVVLIGALRNVVELSSVVWGQW